MGVESSVRVTVPVISTASVSAPTSRYVVIPSAPTPSAETETVSPPMRVMELVGVSETNSSVCAWTAPQA